MPNKLSKLLSFLATINDKIYSFYKYITFLTYSLLPI